MTRDLPRNLVSAAVVLLLHAVFILALVAVMYRPPAIPAARFIELLLRPPVRVRAVLPLWAEPSRTITAPQIPMPQVDVSPAAPTPTPLEGLGRSLSGCAIDNLASLTPDQRMQCGHFSFGRPQEPSLRLGPVDENSPFAQAIAKRNAPAVPIEHACTPQESPIANLGVPCYGFPSGTITGLLNGGN
ncbi:MAG TPA: hypothetical protein VII49_05240 [Rhizomicrobium sp.]